MVLAPVFMMQNIGCSLFAVSDITGQIVLCLLVYASWFTVCCDCAALVCNIIKHPHARSTCREMCFLLLFLCVENVEGGGGSLSEAGYTCAALINCVLMVNTIVFVMGYFTLAPRARAKNYENSNYLLIQYSYYTCP